MRGTMLPPMTVRLISADDWKGLYINGKLKHQGHSIPTHVWLELLKGEQIFLEEYDGAMDKLWDKGRLPDTFTEVREEYGV